MDMKKNCALDFWRLIIKARQKFPRFHIILRCALALSPTSVDVERLFSLLNRINWADRRSLKMDLLEKLLIVARDSLPFTVYDFDPVVEVYRKKRRVRALRGERADKGNRRRRDGGLAETDGGDVDDDGPDDSADEGTDGVQGSDMSSDSDSESTSSSASSSNTSDSSDSDSNSDYL